MRGTGAIAAILFAAGTVPAAAAAPDLAACPPVAQAEGWERERTRPLPVPPALRSTVRANLLQLAVSTLGGGTVCIDTSFMETADRMALSPDGRFLMFGWLGYESYGHIVVDRVGKGASIETGVAPVFSPRRRYFAAADQTEAEFGSLSGLSIWEVNAAGTTQTGRVEELPRMHNWRVDSWGGESCINLSAVSLDLPPEQAQSAPRVRYRAGPGLAGWMVSRNPEGCTTR